MSAPTTAPGWLTDAVLYQIYPQSFADSDGDGVGDLRGIAEHLDHLAWLGVTAVWLNPCFASPMRDAGYDVSDYLSIAPRYGSNDDLAKLVEQAAERGIKVLLDLVPGHTSDQHPWFLASAADPDDHRYIWTDGGEAEGSGGASGGTSAGGSVGAGGAEGRLPAGFVASPGSRGGGYLPNFFEFQPALNFGYARQDPAEPWRQPVDAEGPRANRAALREIMTHWLGLGVAGFRVDMASSLVKDDPGFVETGKLWSELRDWLDREHPGAALLSEWGDPAVSVPAGFHADFFLQFGGEGWGLPYRSLFQTADGTVDAEHAAEPCYFDAAGEGSATTFLAAYARTVAAIGEPGHAILPTANHDFARMHCVPRTAEQLPAAFAFQLTFPTVPAIYYGDEIGMRYVPDLPEKEGSVLGPHYNRAGSRTPMQWSPGANAGFSSGPADRLYLPVDTEPGAPDVATQRADENSLLHVVRDLITLRRENPELGPTGSLEVLHDGYPLAYIRGGRFLVVVNPSGRRVELAIDGRWDPAAATPCVRGRGVEISGTSVTADPFAFGVFRF
ncbi:MAG TPA: alpha-amylase family glycosyl hydrolase [Actinospica sp.]|nr:alpha-amylase family glycosyl hydrolase [Actinospica sp.]